MENENIINDEEIQTTFNSDKLDDLNNVCTTVENVNEVEENEDAND